MNRLFSLVFGFLIITGASCFGADTKKDAEKAVIKATLQTEFADKTERTAMASFVSAVAKMRRLPLVLQKNVVGFTTEPYRAHTIEERSNIVVSLVKTYRDKDGWKMITVPDGRKIKIWDLETGLLLKEFLGHSSVIRCLEIIEDDGRPTLLTGTRAGTVRVWDLATGKCRKNIALEDFDVSCMAPYKVDEQWKMVMGDVNGKVKDIDIKTGTCLNSFDVSRCVHDITVNQVGNDCKALLTMNSISDLFTHVFEWDLSTNNCTKIEKALCRDGSGKLELYDSGAQWGKVQLYGLPPASSNVVAIMNHDKILAKLLGHTDKIDHIQVNQNKNICASASRDHTVRIWDIPTQRCLHVLQHAAPVRKVAVCADGSKIVSVTKSHDKDDQLFHVWSYGPSEFEKRFFPKKAGDKDKSKDVSDKGDRKEN